MNVNLGPGPAGMLVVVAGLAIVSGRLLGIRLRWWRAVVAGFPGLVIGIVVIWALTGSGRSPRSLPVVAVLFAALLATMLIAVLLELLARPGRFAEVQGRLAARGLPHPIRSLRARAGRARRYAAVMRIAGRHGLASFLGGRRHRGAGEGRAGQVAGQARARQLGRNLRAALEESGGMFVKLGQLLSTRADLLPADVIAELSGLQDDVPAAPPGEIEALLTAELGAPSVEVFAWFDPEPLAAGSIAQVHRARQRTGEVVVVKVQRPGVRALVERDLDIVLRLARSVAARAGWARQFRVVELAEGFADSLSEELDFRIEARNIAAVAASSAIRMPAVHGQLSTSRVLVLELLDGVSARDAGPLLERLGSDRAGLARGLLESMLQQVMIGGTFHADPHPGNVLVLPGGELALIDFGLVGRLDPLLQAGLRRLLLAVARRDPGELHDALLDLAVGGHRPADEALERALAQFMAQHLGPGMVPDASLFSSLFSLLAGFGITFPPVIGGVFRAMVTLEGTLTLLAPGFQLMEEARALASALIGPQLAASSLREAATDELLGLLPLLRGLPRRLDRVTGALERGTLSVNVRVSTADRDARWLATAVNRAVMAFTGATLGLMSVGMLAIRGGPVLAGASGGLTLFRLLGYLGLFFSVVLILRVMIAVLREGTAQGNGR